MTQPTCDTCSNPQHYALLAWGDGFRCYECAPDKPPAPGSPSGFDDVEWWDMSDLEASVQASMEPRR